MSEVKKLYLCFNVTYQANLEIEHEEGQEWETTSARAKEYVWNNMNDGIEAEIQMDDVTERVAEDKVMGYDDEEEWLEVKLEEETW